jgi:acetyl-CoA C-acetyltransferase
MAAVRSMGFAGVDPTIMGVGPVPASCMALQKIGLQAKGFGDVERYDSFK